MPEEVSFVSINNFYSHQHHTPVCPAIELNAGIDAKRCTDMLIHQINTGEKFHEETETKLIFTDEETV